MTIERLLILRTGGLGDCLLLWPAICATRRRMGGATIELMGHPERLSLLVGADGADRALDVEGTGLHRLYQMDAELSPELRSRFGAYDAIVAFAAAGDYALAENLSACGAGEVHAFLPQPPEDESEHIATYAQRVLRQVGLADGAAPRPLPVTAEERAAGERRLAQVAGAPPPQVVVLAPGSGSPHKNWPPVLWAGLSEQLRGADLRPLWLEGPADAAAMTAVRAALIECGAPPPRVLAGAGLVELRGLLAAADRFVGNDSGPGHLAGALGTPTLVLFGPTEPARFRPVGPAVEALWAERLEELAVETVAAAVLSLKRRREREA